MTTVHAGGPALAQRSPFALKAPPPPGPASQHRPDPAAVAEPVGDRVRSPLLSALAGLPPQELAARLRAEAERRGTPLLETDGDGRTVLTFLHHASQHHASQHHASQHHASQHHASQHHASQHHGAEHRAPGAEQVLLVLNRPADGRTLAESSFEEIPGTGWWHLSLRVTDSWRGSYAIAAAPQPPPPDETSAAGDSQPGGKRHAGPAPRDAARQLRLEHALARSAPEDHGAIRRWFELTASPERDPWAREHLDSRVSVAAAPQAPVSSALIRWQDSAAGGMLTGVPSGTIHHHRLEAEADPGRAAGTQPARPRQLAVHVPAQLPPTGGWGLIVLLDGGTWLEAGVAEILDTLAASRLIRPSVTVLLGRADDPWRGVDLGCNEAFVRELDERVLPWVGSRWPLSADPDHAVIAGQSLGGLTAIFAQALAPHRFSASVSQSGSFWWPVRDSTDPDSQWLIRAIAESEAHLDRVWLESGLKEWSQVLVNRRMRAVLAERTCHLVYREFDGGHDRACWRESLADALVAVLTPDHLG